jgi:hypothetical protein
MNETAVSRKPGDAIIQRISPQKSESRGELGTGERYGGVPFMVRHTRQERIVRRSMTHYINYYL